MVAYSPIMDARAQGWYRDPYAIHEDRYFSAGMPTKLVRDRGQESYDPPPDRPLPEIDLIPAETGGSAASPGDDLKRADQPSPVPVSQLLGGGKVAPFDLLPAQEGETP
jgi:hypothetical protein